MKFFRTAIIWVTASHTCIFNILKTTFGLAAYVMQCGWIKQQWFSGLFFILSHSDHWFQFKPVKKPKNRWFSGGINWKHWPEVCKRVGNPLEISGHHYQCSISKVFQRFSGIFGEYKVGALARNELKKSRQFSKCVHKHQ